MSFRFWPRIRLVSWVTLNLSKSTAFLSIGLPGAKYMISPRGNRATAGIPTAAARTGLRGYCIRSSMTLRFFTNKLVARHRRVENLNACILRIRILRTFVQG